MTHPRLSLVFAVSASLIAPAAAIAQARTFVSSSFTAAHTYESNLFATPASLGPQADFISQFGPSLIAGYESLPFEFAVSYEILAERYQRHAELNDNAARQQTGVMLRYRPRERFSVNVDAGYIATHTPSEFNLQSGLGAGRAPAERLSLASGATFNFTPATTVNVSYTLDRDALIGRMTTATHRPRLGFATRTGERNTYRIEYERRQFAFSGGAPAVSHAVVGGWVHELSPRVGCEIAIGPRVTDAAVRPDVAARWRWRFEDVDLQLSYMRTDMTAVGEIGTFDAHALATAITYRPARRVTVDVSPLVSRNARGQQDIIVYALNAASRVAVTRRFVLAADARISRQDGSLTGPRRLVSGRSVGLHLTFSPLRNDRDVTRKKR